MKALFIGGTGNISTAVTRLALERGIQVWHLNRGRSAEALPGVETLTADVGRPGELEQAIGPRTFDVVVNFIAFKPADVARDLRVFEGRAGQYIFISSASVYQKPPAHPIVSESTPLANPFWDYAQAKIACEDALVSAYRERAFPMTIVRPSLTYDTVIPVPLGGWREYTIVERIRKKKKIIVHGDGTSLWTVTHSDDFARGLLGLFGEPRAIGHAFHITSDELLTWDQIHQALAAAVGAEPRIVHVPSDLIAKLAPSRAGSLLGDKSPSLIFDNSKIKSVVPEYRASIAFAQGIRRTLDWFDAQASRRQIDPQSDAEIDRILAQYARAFPDASD
ncbi:MAG TPA: SDR family oxidoreductase [Polyangiaceae bacterium]|nr:SDR family oxidoreductase [Polyangiaceae bacterium]